METIRTELIDELIKGYQKPDDIIGKDGLLKQLTKAIVERALSAELTQHLGHEKHAEVSNPSGNTRNGTTSKTLKTDHGDLSIEVPRDRDSSFMPQMVRKGQRRFTGFDDKILSMYSRGMTVRDIQGHLQDLYGVEVSPDLISSVTDSILEEVKAWQNRPLDRVYAILYLDALFLKVKQDGHILNKAVYVAIGITLEGHKDVLGIWLEETEGAKFWLKVITELRNRGVEDIYIACVDGLKGFPEAIESVYPKTEIQLCIVHMIRNSLKYVSYKERKDLAQDLKPVYQSPTEEAAQQALTEFAAKWDRKYPVISKSWRANWVRLSTFFAYPAEIRRIIYTTNAVESLNYVLRKVTKNRAAFPTDEAAIKLLYMALKNHMKKWTMPLRDWGVAMNQFSILFKERVPE